MSLQLIIPEMFNPGGPALNAMMIEWCLQRLGITGATFTNGAVAIGVTEGENQLISVTVFDNFRRGPTGQPLSIECSMAADSPRWARRGIIQSILYYPFCQLRVQRMTNFVAESNTRSAKVTRGLGFKNEGVVREALENGENMLIFGMTRADAAKWLGDLVSPARIAA